MPAWLIPALKAVLPHLGTIVSAAAPAFTRKSVAANQTMLLQQQITELQAAASANDAHIKELAAQIQNTVAALESGRQRILVLSIAATVLSVTALCIALFILVAR